MLPVISILFIITVFAGCSSNYGGKHFFNRNYVMPTDQDNMKLAILPIYGRYKTFSDSLLADAFLELYKPEQLVQPGLFRKKMRADKGFRKTAIEIIQKVYTQDELTRIPTLAELVTETEYNYFKEQIGKADLLLVPGEFNIISIELLGVKAGSEAKGKFRVYDLKTGGLVFIAPLKDKVNELTGKVAEDLLTERFIYQIQMSYAERFITN